MSLAQRRNRCTIDQVRFSMPPGAVGEFFSLGEGRGPRLADGLRNRRRNSKVWAFCSTLEFRRSHIKAELRKLVEGN